MQQLTELDAMFIQQESNRTPMHISPVIFYDQSTLGGDKVRFKDILTCFERNLHKSRIFRRRLAGGALGLDTPYWVEDGHFDLEFHVRHIALPKPGDWRQLCILLARLHSRGLDMRRPLWEAYVIEGLNNVEGLPENSFVLMLKVHHAAIDGVSGAEIITAIHSLTDERLPPRVPDDWQPERNPSPWQVWSRAYVNNLKRPLKLVETVGEMIPAALRAQQLKRDEDQADRPAMVRTRFNARVSGQRVTDGIVLDLDEVKAIKREVDGSTVNDVIVAVVGGGLRKYLEAHGELPADSLACGAPINVRKERNADSAGNQVGMMTLDLATDVEQPLKRLQVVSRHAQESKAYTEAIGASALMDVTSSLTPQILGLGMRAAVEAALHSDIGLPVHTVVSNVPGPQVPLYLAGARVHMMMGMGPVLDMAGLFHGVISAAGKITINATACRELMPDPGFYRECLQSAYDELRDAALG